MEQLQLLRVAAKRQAFLDFTLADLNLLAQRRAVEHLATQAFKVPFHRCSKILLVLRLVGELTQFDPRH